MAAGSALLAASALGPAVWRVVRVAAVLAAWRRLPRIARTPGSADVPLVSVVVPARNEERSLGACLASLTAQRHPCLEIVVVDDGSVDRTPGILAEAAARDPRVCPLRVAGPPPGWTGRTSR